MQLSELIHRFEIYLLSEKRAARNTLDAYMRDLQQLSNYCIQQELTLVPAITPVHIKDFIKTLHDSGLEARSIARKVCAIKSLYQFAHDRFSIANIGKHLYIPTIEKKLPRYLSTGEVEQLLRVADQDSSERGFRNNLVLQLLYMTGMRISELVGLTWDRIDLEQRTLLVEGKRDRQRYIPLPEVLATLLQTYQQQVHIPLQQAHGQTIPYLFPSLHKEKVKPITRQTCWGLINELWAKTGNQKSISPHQLRHSLATHLLERGVNLRSIQQLLGHERITTVQVYTHVEVSHLRSIYNKKHPRSR